jgi:acetyl esterase/lipase
LSNASGPDAVIHEIVLNEAATAAPVVVYFHGGGYHNALVKQAHVPGAYEIGTQLRASSVFLLEYTLTPGAKYPTQLQQAVLAWNYLLNEREIVPARILLGGDSAGGHLALTLLAHGMQPCPGVTPMAQLGPDENRLKGLLLISPWPNMRADVPSFRMFEHIDMINIEGVHDFIDLYGPRLGEVWAEPLAADRSFWANLPVENLLVTCGNAECLRDSIVELFDGLKAAEENGARCDLIFAEGEIHVHSALDYVLGIGPCESRRGIIDWVRRLS